MSPTVRSSAPKSPIRSVTARIALIALGVAALTSCAQSSRERISIVGSSTVYPFSTVVAERFGRTTKFKVPTVESTGSGGGLKLFCKGVGMAYPDITNASRRIKASEVALCGENNVEDIIEIKIGYDGIVLANAVNAPQLDVSRRDLFLALAKQVPNPDGSATLIDNPYITWNDVKSGLPDIDIEVMGPPPTSGTRDAFVELAMEGGCKTFDFIKAMKKSDKNKYKSICHTVREDGAFIEAGEQDNLIVNKLRKNADSFGIMGFSFLEQNADMIQGSLVDGVGPSFNAIADGSYPISRPLFFYVKKLHVGFVPGIQEFLNAFTNEDAAGGEGYLTDHGLIPLPATERKKVLADVESLTPMTLAAI
ncbi:MAG: substrate-binding domain-containing protein [Gammaproteobacteria bacterium]